jgi:hypothetical protein
MATSFVSLASGFSPTVGMTFPVFFASAMTATLNFDFTAAVLPSGLGWAVNFGPTSLGLVVVSVPNLAGDYNSDGAIDAADYTRYRDALGTNTVLPNDPTGGTIGVAQYNTWRNNFGNSNNSSVLAATASVPEPASVVVMLVLFATVRCIGPRITRQIENERKSKCPR